MKLKNDDLSEQIKSLTMNLNGLKIDLRKR